MNYSTLSAEAHAAVFAWNGLRKALSYRSKSCQLRVGSTNDFQPPRLNFSDTRTTKLERNEQANLTRGFPAGRYAR